MSDWQTLTSDNFPAAPPEDRGKGPAAGRRGRSRLLLAGGLLLAVLIAGILILIKQRAEKQAALRQDLAAAIFEEEALRRLGKMDEVLIVAGAPAGWQEAYRRTFEAEQPPPGTVQLAEIESFDGVCALVTVTGPPTQPPADPIRAYCLTHDGWQRAPISPTAWGEAPASFAFTNGVRLQYWERDRAFAQALAGDLADFFRQAGHLSIWPATSPRSGRAFDGLEIIIQPHDLQGPLILDEPGRIIINSPELVSHQTARLFVGREVSTIAAGLTPEDAQTEEASDISARFGAEHPLSPEAAGRLALAKALLRRANLTLPEPTPTLPGAGRLAQAAQVVTAMRLLLTPEMTDSLLAAWRSQLNGRWVSPFYAGLLPAPAASPPPQAGPAALLLADYIYLSHGLPALPRLVQQLSTATSWDRLFQTQLGRSMPEIELEAAQYAEANSASLAPLRRYQAAPVRTLPLTAKLQQIGPLSNHSASSGDSASSSDGAPSLDDAALAGGAATLRLYVKLSDRVEPLLVETPPGARFQTPGGLSLSPGCLIAGASLTLAGDWLETGRRLLASRVTIQRLPPLEVGPAPADAVAYLMVTNLQPRPVDVAAATMPPNNRPYIRAETLSPSETFIALRADGSLQPLLTLQTGMRLVPLPIAAGQSPHFLFQFDRPNCERSWFAHYEPEHGLSQQWFGPAETQWVWRQDRLEPLFFEDDAGRRNYYLYESDQTHVYASAAGSDRPVALMGWHAATQQPVVVFIRSGNPLLGLLDIETGRISNPVLPDLRGLETRRLSPAGEWLVYPANPRHLFGSSNRVDVLDLSQDRRATLIELAADQRLGHPVWSLYLEQPQAAFVAGPVGEPVEQGNDTFRSIRLLVAQPDHPGEYTLVTEVNPGERLATPRFCRDGSLLYRVEQAGRYHLRRQRPGAPAQTLLTLGYPVRPLACS